VRVLKRNYVSISTKGRIRMIKIKSIVLISRKWWNPNGYTCGTVSVIVNGNELETSRYECSYSATQTAVKILKKHHTDGVIEIVGELDTTTLWRYCENNGIALHEDEVTVQRRKDLHYGGR